MNETVGKPFKVSSLTEAVELKAKLAMTEKAIHNLRVDEVIDVSITLESGRLHFLDEPDVPKETEPFVEAAMKAFQNQKNRIIVKLQKLGVYLD